MKLSKTFRAVAAIAVVSVAAVVCAAPGSADSFPTYNVHYGLFGITTVCSPDIPGGHRLVGGMPTMVSRPEARQGDAVIGGGFNPNDPTAAPTGGNTAQNYDEWLYYRIAFRPTAGGDWQFGNWTAAKNSYSAGTSAYMLIDGTWIWAQPGGSVGSFYFGNSQYPASVSPVITPRVSYSVWGQYTWGAIPQLGIGAFTLNVLLGSYSCWQ